nr:MAG TPA: hypothetical protein [Caudoviricetes sp.]
MTSSKKQMKLRNKDFYMGTLIMMTPQENSLDMMRFSICLLLI